jgi:VIT family
MSDGVTGAISQTHVIVTAGLSEIAAGSIAMGLGGYLAARSDADHYNWHSRVGPMIGLRIFYCRRIVSGKKGGVTNEKSSNDCNVDHCNGIGWVSI